MQNPLTREVVRRMMAAEWAARLSEIEFPFTLSDISIGGVPCVRYQTPKTRPDRPLFLYIHASAYTVGSPRANAAALLPACHLSGCEAVAVAYSLAPEAVYPTQLNQIAQVWRGLIEERAPESVVLVGDSAGAALAVASMNRWRRQGLPSPGGTVVISGLFDGAGDSDTHLALAGRDPIFASRSRAGVIAATALYAPHEDPRHPDISPVYADFRGAPPLLVQVGSRDSLLGDSARLSERARRDGVHVRLRVFDGMFHLFHMHFRLEEAKAAHEDIARFIEEVAARDLASGCRDLARPAAGPI